MRLRRVHFWVFLGVVALAPLPLGANRPFAWTLLAAAIAGLTLLWPLAVARERGAPANGIAPLAVPGALFLAVVVWMAAQIWLEPALVPWLSALWDPPPWSPLWGDVAAALETDPATTGRIGLSPSAGTDNLIRLSSYALGFWLAYQHAASSRRANAMIDGLAVVAVLYALYGLAAFYSDSRTILWMDKWAYHDNLTSTFVNRNSYAAYAGLGLLAALAAIARRLEDVTGWRRLLPHLARPAMAYFLSLAISAPALLATESRGGVAAAIAGVAVFAYCLYAPRLGMWRRIALGVALPGVVLLAFGLFLHYGATHPDSEAADRFRVYALTVNLIADRPWTGYGPGSFPDVFAMARTPDISQVWLQAHCLYLELALELGLPAALALCGCVVGIFAACLKTAFRHPERRTQAALGCAATALVAAHALLDFSMQIPAVALTWAVITGTAMGRAARADKSRA